MKTWHHLLGGLTVLLLCQQSLGQQSLAQSRVDGLASRSSLQSVPITASLRLNPDGSPRLAGWRSQLHHAAPGRPVRSTEPLAAPDKAESRGVQWGIVGTGIGFVRRF